MFLTFAIFSTEPFRTATAFVPRWIHSYITTTVTTITARLALTCTRGNCQKKHTTVSDIILSKDQKKVDFHYLLFSEACGSEFFWLLLALSRNKIDENHKPNSPGQNNLQTHFYVRKSNTIVTILWGGEWLNESARELIQLVGMVLAVCCILYKIGGPSDGCINAFQL